MISNVSKTNSGKLLAAVVAMLMIVCAIAVVAMPAEGAEAGQDATSVELNDKLGYGNTVNMDQDVWDGLTATQTTVPVTVTTATGAKVVKLNSNQTWNLTGDVTATNATIDLNGFNLKIVGDYDMSITYAGTAVSAALISSNAAQAANVWISGSTVSLIANSAQPGFAVEAMNINQFYVSDGASLTVNKTATADAEGTIWHTDAGSYSTYGKVTDNNTVLYVVGSNVTFSNGTAAGSGVQSTAIVAEDNSTINAENLGEGSLSVYAKLDNSKIEADILGLYAAEMTNGASIAAKTLGLYSGKVNAGFAGFNTANVNMAAGTSITATTIINSLTAGTSAGSATAINGQGTVSGNITSLASSSTTYTLNGVTLDNVTTEGVTGITVGAGGIVTSGTTDLSDVTTFTVNAGTPVIVKSGTTTFPTNYSNGAATIVNDGAKAKAGETAITGVDPENVTVSNGAALATMAAQPNTPIKLQASTIGDITLDQDVVLAEGSYFVKDAGAAAIVLGDHSIVNNNGGNNYIKVKDADSNSSFFILELNGDFTLSKGSSVHIDMDVVGGATEDAVNQITLRTGHIVISGSLSDKLTLVVDEKNPPRDVSVTFKDFTVNAGATLQLVAPTNTAGNDNIVYNTEGSFGLYGNLIANAPVDLTVGSLDGFFESTFTGYPGAVIQQNVTLVDSGNEKNKINLDESLRTMEISVDVTGFQSYSQLQTVVIVTSLNITPYATLEIMGQLVVNEGVTLTINGEGKLIVNSSTAEMIVNGSIIVEGDGEIIVSDAKNVDVAGSITSSGTVTIDSKVTVEENGSILIDNDDGSTLVVTEGLTVNAGGSVEVRGEMAVADITNKGTVTLNGATLTTATVDTTEIKVCKISMAAEGATVDIKSFVSKTTDNKLTITDSGLVLFDDRKDDNKDITVGKTTGYTANEMTFTATYGETGIRNLTVTECLTSEKKDNVTVYHYGMDIAGSAAIVDERDNPADDEVAKYTVQLTGVRFDVLADTTLTLGAGITLDNDAVMNVDGTVYAVAGAEGNKASIANGGTINVSGMVETVDEKTIEVGTLNAVKYEADVEGNTHYYYTTLATAIANGAEEIYVMDTIKVLENVTIPTGVTLRAADNGSQIIVGDADHRDVVMTVTAGATVRGFGNQNGGIDVYATLEFQDIKDNKTGNIIYSDVQVDAAPARTYTNIYTALNNAEAGETVTITRTSGNVVLTDDIEVKTGVTLSIPNSKTVEIENGVTLTVNGTVQMVGEIVGETGVVDAFNPMNGTTEKDADDYAVITVNGTIRSVDQLPYATTDTEFGYYIAGAYYNIIDNTGDYWYVTPVAQAAAVSNSVSDEGIEIYGKNTVTDVDFTGDEDQGVTVTIVSGAELNAGTVTLSYAKIDVDGAFTGTIDSAVGSIAVVNATGFTAEGKYVDETEVLTVAETPVMADQKGAKTEITIATGTVTVDASFNITSDSIDSFEIASGATLAVDGNNGRLVADDMTVDGTLYALNGGRVSADVLTVRGTFTVAENDDANDITAGSATVNQLFVGIAYDGDNEWYTDASAAAVNAASLGNNLTRIVVSAESTVTGDLTNNMPSTEFYVEDALWITVYIQNGQTAFAYQIGSYEPELPESKFVQWNGVDGKKVTEGTLIGATENVEKVYAEIDYDVYAVIVYGDSGIGNIAIDGQLLISNGNGIFYLPGEFDVDGVLIGGLDAGQHTITYTLKPNYEGTPTLAATGVNATVSGLNFTLSGAYYGEDGINDVNITTLTLSGTTPADTTVVIEGGNGGSNDMGLTDYLLIILVVLIVIMAIMVAMRLMRS